MAALSRTAAWAWLVALADVLGAQADPIRALKTLEGAGPASAALSRRVAAILQTGRNLGTALLEVGCLTPVEAEALRTLEVNAVRAAGLRLLIERRRRRAARRSALWRACGNPLVLTLITLLSLSAPILVLGLAPPWQALRPTVVFLAVLGLGMGLGGVVMRRFGPAVWGMAASLPGVGPWVQRQAEAEIAFALAELGAPDAVTPAALSVAAALVPAPVHAAWLRAAGARAEEGAPVDRILVEPFDEGLRLLVVGGAAIKRLPERAARFAQETDERLTARLALVVRLCAYVVLLATSWLATDALMHLDIQIPGLSLPGFDGGSGPYPDLDHLLEQELQ